MKEDKLTDLPLGLTFDDVLLLPGTTDFKREEVQLDVDLGHGLVLQLPVISSPMDTVTEYEMALAMGKNGGLGVIHRNLNPQVQADMVAEVKKSNVKVGAAVGSGHDLEERITALINAQVDLFVVDSGHGASIFVVEAVRKIKSMTQIPVMAGNVATAEGAQMLIDAGTDILRVGMGPGSICTTRVVTGMGVPQLQAISECLKAASKHNVPVVADGGIKQIGDIAKALALGAHAVIMGSLLAGFDQSPGEIVNHNGEDYKRYRGMGSIAAMKKGGAERYGQDRNTETKKMVAEGVESLVKCKGDVNDFLFQIAGGLRSSFYYIGGKTYEEFVGKARFTRITQSSLLESHPHSVMIMDSGASYIESKK